MVSTININDIIDDLVKEENGIWYGPEGGYWSNLEKSENTTYLNDLKSQGVFNIVRKHFPQHEEVIFSSKRIGGIATLDISENDLILDAGCMWGAISVPLANTKANVVSIDQTEESLLFLAQRRREQRLDNLHLVCADLRKIDFKDEIFDKVIINGVLEWLPEKNKVEVDKFLKKENHIFTNLRLIFSQRSKEESAREIQERFLKKINRALKDNGVLYLAIENRYDFLAFLGIPEPHCGIRFISFLPRGIQNILSLLSRGREFRNWTYSRRQLINLLRSAGFTKFIIYYGFPNYIVPDLVVTDNGMKFFKYCSSAGRKPLFKKIILRLVEDIIYNRFRLTFFAPTFIVHAYK